MHDHAGGLCRECMLTLLLVCPAAWGRQAPDCTWSSRLWLAAQTCSGPAAGPAGLEHWPQVMYLDTAVCALVSSVARGRVQGLPAPTLLALCCRSRGCLRCQGLLGRIQLGPVCPWHCPLLHFLCPCAAGPGDVRAGRPAPSAHDLLPRAPAAGAGAAPAPSGASL